MEFTSNRYVGMKVILIYTSFTHNYFGAAPELHHPNLFPWVLNLASKL
jgi:hypothetical protein